MTTSFETLSHALSEIITQTSGSVVAIQGRRSASTGIHWRKGLIVTSCEALAQDHNLTLHFPNGQTVKTELLGSDPTTDVAILALPEGYDLPVVTIGDAQALALGQLVSTVGRSARRGVFTSLGMVSQVSGPWRSQRGGQIDQRIIVDLRLARGSAGCPLIDASGKVVGFNTFGPRRKILTIPASTVDKVVDQLQQRGKIARGYLGLGMQTVPLPENIQQQHKLGNQSGIMVVSVDPGSAADQAGMLLGDVMVKINDDILESLPQIQALLGPSSVGQTFNVILLRGGQLQTVAVTVGER
ncbi:MAG: S1C family serine protease [Cyanobacteria bacterium P01_F01_bin.53]